MIVERSSKRNLMRLVDLVNFVSRDYAEGKPYEDKKEEEEEGVFPATWKREEGGGGRVSETKIFGSHARRRRRRRNVSWNDGIGKRSRNRVFLVFLEGRTDNFTVNTGETTDRWNTRGGRERRRGSGKQRCDNMKS